MAATYLIVRARDLVVLAVSWEGCEVRTPTSGPPVLEATGSLPKMTLTFPPQAILEQTTSLDVFDTAGKVHSDSRLTGTSELVFQVRRGTKIALSAAGILRALNTVNAFAIEMPWGLRLKPPQTTNQTMVSRHPADPLPAAPDTVGLWQAVLHASDGNRADARLAVRPELVNADPQVVARPLFSTPPLTGWRNIIASNGATSPVPVPVNRLELSALGGSLSAAVRWPSDSWSHEIRLGRDQKVEVEALGRLWPFGHRVVYRELIRRQLLPVQGSTTPGKVAALKARRVLVILEPIRTGLRAPTFPFDEVEIVGREFHVNPLGAPPDPHMFMPSGATGAPLQIPVRCRSGSTEVRFAIPVIVMGDAKTQPDPILMGRWKTHATVDIPGVEIDMIGAGGKPGDIQEVHSLTLNGAPDGTRFRPTLDKFTVELPALRSLLPGGGHDKKHTLQYAPGIGTGPIPPVPLRFVTDSVSVDFTGNTDRSGALVAPLFKADGISRELGPIPRNLQDPPNLEDALKNAFGGATLFGFPLAELIDPNAINPKPGPPKIIQRREGDVAVVEFRWEKLRLRTHGSFQPASASVPPQLDLTVVSGAETRDAADPKPTCALTNFKLALPSDAPLITLAFDEVAFTHRPSKPMKLDIAGLNVAFGKELRLLEELQRKVMKLLGAGAGPNVAVSPTEIVVSYLLRIPDAPAGMFVMRNVAVQTAVHVPFAEKPVRVVVGFASREHPFSLTVSGFGGGGYAAVEIAGNNPSKLELSLEFGAMLAINFVVAQAEVHALGGARFVRDANGGTELEAFIRIGGSVQLLGLITVSIELRVALTFSDEPEPKLTGRASLVIELDLTLYSETVTVDSGKFELIGGTARTTSLTGPALAIDDRDETRQLAWDSYWEAFA